VHLKSLSARRFDRNEGARRGAHDHAALIKNALKNKAIEKRAPLTQAESEQALATMIKQRRDSIDQFDKGNRPDLSAKEAAEVVIIEEFLPKALDEAGLAALVTEAIAEVTAQPARNRALKRWGWP